MMFSNFRAQPVLRSLRSLKLIAVADRCATWPIFRHAFRKASVQQLAGGCRMTDLHDRQQTST